MSRRQLTLLFLSSLLPYIAGNSILSVIALYARQLGADTSATGFYLATAFAVLATGSLSSGWLSARFGRRKLFVSAAAALSIPVVLLMGRVTDIVQLTIVTSVLWLLFGISTTTVNILTGLFVDPRHRGRTFGLVAMSLALSQLIGGSIAGPLVDRWGFQALFAFDAVVYAALVVIALLLQDKPQPLAHAQRVERSRAVAPTQPVVLMLLAASTLAAAVSFSNNMIRPLVMDAHSFSMTAITSTIAISGLVRLPLQLLVGWLADRVGRRFTLLLCYLLPAVGIVLMSAASELWQFWLAQALITVVSTGSAAGSALMTDLVDADHLSITLSRFSATTWLGAVLGFTLIGLAVRQIGMIPALLLTGVLAVIAAFLVTRTLPRRSPLFTQPAQQVGANSL